MEKTRKLSIKDESEQEVRQIEKELDDHPELDNIQVTKEMDDALFAKIRELEEKEYRKEKQENRISEPEKRYRRKRTKHWYLVLAAVLVLVFAFGSVSVGSKSYWKELLDVIVGDESVKVINVEDMDKQSTGDVDEVNAYNEIGDKLGITVAKLVYKPQTMKLTEYTIDKELGQAKLFFKYNGESIRYTIYSNNEDSSRGIKKEDEKVESYVFNKDGIAIEVEGFQKPGEQEVRRVANFEYQGIQYELKGVMEKDKFDKILKNLYFYKKCVSFSLFSCHISVTS